MFRLWQGSRTRHVPHPSVENFLSLKRRQPPAGARFPLGLRLTPLHHSCHGFGLHPNRASPGPFLQVLQRNSLAVGRGGRGRVVSAYAYTHRIPRPPGHGASISQARCPRPWPPPGNRGSLRLGF